MPKLDELLQQKLDALEQGAAPEATLQSLPAGAEELKPLIALAAEVRELPHPQPSPEHSRVLLYKILAVVREQSRERVSRHAPARLNGCSQQPWLAQLSYVFLRSLRWSEPACGRGF